MTFVTLSFLFTSCCTVFKQQQKRTYTLEGFSCQYYEDSTELYIQLYSTLTYERQCRPDKFEGIIPVKLINTKGILSAEFTPPTACISDYLEGQITSLLTKLHFDRTKSEILTFYVYFDYGGEGVEPVVNPNTVYLRDYLVPEVIFH